VTDALRVLPDSGSSWSSSSSGLSQSPEINVPIRLASTGTWYVWVRMYAPNSSGNTVHVGIDGDAGSSSDDITTSTTGSWVWTRTRSGLFAQTARISASAGAHTLHIWAGEDGVNVDRIILTTDSGYTPNGNGPAQSQRVDATSPTVAGRFPSPNATGVPVNTSVTALFSEAIAPASVTTSSFTLVRVSNGSTVTATRSAGAGNLSFVLDPTTNLVGNTQYRASVTTAVTDTAGNPIPSTVTWTFTTAP
jgi:hypothetical protein